MARVKSFTRGGISVDPARHLTQDRTIRPLYLPSVAVVALVQYPGARAEWVVDVGEAVAEDQVLARGVRVDDLPVHSPIPGRILEFREIALPWGQVSSAALIRLEGEFTHTGRPGRPVDWEALTDTELWKRWQSAGVLLESSPLDPRRVVAPETLAHLVVNGLQSEPYLTLPLALLKDRAEALAEGIRILLRLLSPGRVHLAVDTGEGEVVHLPGVPGLEVHQLAHRYPQAQEGLLLKTLGIHRDQGPVLTLDLASVLAIRDAVVDGRPQIERNLVVSGRGVRRPGTYRVRIGTPLYQLLRDAGGLVPGDHRILVGGPFHGQAVDNLATPVLKGVQAVLVLDRQEVNPAPRRPCIRCGSCSSACPVGLEPLNLHKALAQGNTALARAEGLALCIECGICSFVCPSRIPLVTEFQAAKESKNGG